MNATVVELNTGQPLTEDLGARSIATLNLLRTYLEEIISEENLGYRAQVTLHQFAVPICVLAKGDESILIDKTHPARAIFDNIVSIAKLCGDQFVPGDALYQTMLESIKNLRQKQVSNYDTLVRVNTDLQHVLKLAKLRAPIERKLNIENAGLLTDAKTIAAILIVHQCHRFDIHYALMHFALTEWLALMVVTIIQKGRDSIELKELDRLTFTLFYLGHKSDTAKQKRMRLSRYLHKQLKRHIAHLGSHCMGHALNFDALFDQVKQHICVAQLD